MYETTDQHFSNETGALFHQCLSEALHLPKAFLAKCEHLGGLRPTFFAWITMSKLKHLSYNNTKKDVLHYCNKGKYQENIKFDMLLVILCNQVLDNKNVPDD